jgi:hypothetical protein
MTKPSRTTRIVAAAAILGSLLVVPAEAGNLTPGHAAKAYASTDFSAARRHYRHNGNAAALAAFGAIAGTIATVAAAQHARDYYDDGYYGGPAYYGGPVYYGGPAYYGHGYGYSPGSSWDASNSRPFP